MVVAKKTAAAKKAAPVKKTAAKKVGATKKAAPAKAAAKAPAKRLPPPLPDNVVPVGEGSGRFIRILVYGEPGSWKTILAGTSPNALILEADRGDESAAGTGSTAKKWSIHDWNDLDEAKSYLQNGGYKNFDWVWLDSLTLFQERGLDMIMEDLVSSPGKGHRKVYKPDKGEYGENMSRISRWLREMIDIPINFGITCHVKRVEDDDTGDVRYMPYVQGKDMPEKVCSYFGLIGHMEITLKEGEEHPVFSTRKDGKFYTKDRFGVVGRMLDPTIPKIMARVEQSRKSGGAVRARKATRKRSQ